MASIVKRNGSYRVTARVNGRRVSKTFKLKASAVAWGAQQDALNSKVKEVGYGKTLREALVRYRELVSPTKKWADWDLKRVTWLENTLPFVDKLLIDISQADISAWRDASTSGPGTVRRNMTLLSSVFSYCVKEWNWLDRNPMDTVRKPTPPRPRNAIYTDAQIELVYQDLLARGPKTRQVACLFKLAIETGMRSSEMVTLSTDQVDLADRVVHLYKTKNGDQRDVPLSAEGVSLLRRQIETLPTCEGSQPLFSLSPESRDVLFRRTLRFLGVEGLTFHDTRATAITRLAKVLDILTLARMVGHRDLRSLQVYYREPASETAKRLDRLNQQQPEP